MPTAPSDGFDIYYETAGDPAGEPLVLVMGFGAQLTGWPEGLVAKLVESGFFVVRLDNREIGLSSRSTGQPPDAFALLTRALGGDDVSSEAPYTLSDMAADVVAVLDAVGVDAAHAVGASMGGMICQHLAIESPSRVRSVTSIMSTTGAPDVGEADSDALDALLAPPPEGRQAIIDRNIEVGRLLAGPIFDRAYTARMAEFNYERSFNPLASLFQLAAIAASGDRTEQLGDVEVPFLVIHGRADPLIGVSGGLATADAIPGADLLVLNRMGHNLPEVYWDQLVGAISNLAGRAPLPTSAR